MNLSPADVEDGRFDWAEWEALIRANGIRVDRPRDSAHPRYPDIIYPLDYGYVNGTASSDGDEVDVFVGSARNGLVGLMVTSDFRKGDREVKLLYDCAPEEIYLANGFINFDRKLMEGSLILRRPMSDLR
jgi:hypothetical protein